MVIDDSIAQTILQQTGQFALISAGAHNFQPLENGVRFDIHVTPHPDGVRPEIMHAEVILEPTDLYSVTVKRESGRNDDFQPHGDGFLRVETDSSAKEPYFRMDDVFYDKLEAIFIGLERGTLHGRRRTAHIPS